MKLWYLALTAVGTPTNVAWVISLFGLIITVRSIIAPFSYIQYRAGRIMVNLRPVLRQLDADNRFIDTGEELKAYEDTKKQAMKDAGHNPAAGCVPALIQIPVFIGLYQVLLRMARPEEGLNSEHHPIGFLSSADVTSFLAVRVDGIPLPAHVMMTAEQYAQLGVTREQVFDFVAPYFIAAAVISSINMLYSLYRSWLTMDFSSRPSRGLYKTFIVMAIITPIFPLTFGLTGPGPAALAFYWFFNTLWTGVQMVVINTILDRKMPISDAFKEVRDREHEEHKENVRAKRRLKRALRRNRLRMLITPWRHQALREATRQEKANWQARLEDKAEEHKKHREARSKARKELDELKKKAKAEEKNTTETPEGDAENSPQGNAAATDTSPSH